MKKEKSWLYILGILFIIVPLFLNFYSILKLISCVLGIVILIITKAINNKKIIISSLGILVISSLVLYGVDLLSVKLFNSYPIISLEEKSSDKMQVYNAVLYRVYNCDNVKTIDMGYKKEFVCNKELLKEIDVNAFLENPKDSYKTNLNKFVRITGKITKIVGNSQIELNSYSTSESLNGYAVFDDNKTIVLKNLNIDEDGVPIIESFVDRFGTEYNKETRKCIIISEKKSNILWIIFLSNPLSGLFRAKIH